MTQICFSPVSNRKKQRPIRYGFIVSHSRLERARLIKHGIHSGFADCWIKGAKSRAKNGAFYSVWQLPAAPVAIRLFKQLLETSKTARKNNTKYQLIDFINYLIANSRTANRKIARTATTAPIVPEKEDRTAERMIEKLRKSAYKEKLAAYKGNILDEWERNGQIERLYCEIERGTLNNGSITGAQLSAKRKKKSARSARIMK